MSDDVVSVGRLSDYPYSAWGTRDKAAAALSQRHPDVTPMDVRIPSHLCPTGFSLYGPRKETRSERVDKLLAAWGIR